MESNEFILAEFDRYGMHILSAAIYTRYIYIYFATGYFFYFEFTKPHIGKSDDALTIKIMDMIWLANSKRKLIGILCAKN